MYVRYFLSSAQRVKLTECITLGMTERAIINSCGFSKLPCEILVIIVVAAV